MRTKIDEHKRSEVIKNYLMGKKRDETAKAASTSEGNTSNTERDFREMAEDTSPENAAEEFNVGRLFDGLRKLGGILDEQGYEAEDVPLIVEVVEKTLQYTSLDKLKDVVPILKNTDKGHLEAAVKLAEYEHKTGMGHEEILEKVAAAEARNKELTEQNEGLTSDNENLKSDKMKLQQSFDDEKARCDAERNKLLHAHNATMEKIEQFSLTVKTLKENYIELSDLELLRNMTRLTRECGGKPKKLFELARTRSSLRSQIRRENSRVCKARKTVTKLHDTKKKLEAEIEKAKPILTKARALKLMGWTNESLNTLSILTGQVGKPTEVLARVELLKPSAEMQANLEATKKEHEALKKENSKIQRKALRQLRKLDKGASALLNEQLPHVLAETERLLQTHIGDLMDKYEELSGKYTTLLNSFSSLQRQYATCQELLDKAIPFSQLIEAPEKLSSNAVDQLLFEFVIPKLMDWSKNRSWKEKTDLAGKLTINGLALYSEEVSSFLASPENASASNAFVAATSVLAVFFPLYTSLKVWCTLHESKGDDHKIWTITYYLDKFYADALTSQEQNSQT